MEALLVQTVPAGAMKSVKRLLAGIFIIMLAFALDFGREFLLPVTLAFFIALAFRPAVRRLGRIGIPAWLATSVFMALVTLSAAGFIYAVSGPVAGWISDAPAYAKSFSEKLRDLRASFESVTHLTDGIRAAADTAAAAPVKEVVVSDNSPMLAFLAQGTGYSAGVVTTVVLTLVIAAFMMASGDLFYEKIVRVLPTLTDKKRALRIVFDVETEVSSYLLMVTAINAGLGLSIGIAFYFLGMPMAYLWGLLAFLFNYIPFVGAITGVALSGFMAVTVFDSLGYALVVPAAYALINGVENQLVTPVFLGRRLQLNSVAILLALTFWSWEWGIAGTMLAVPILVTIKVFCDHLDGLQGIGEFLSDGQAQRENGAAAAFNASPAVSIVE
jgi:predicted PurR-regulated permease PerM